MNTLKITIDNFNIVVSNNLYTKQMIVGVMKGLSSRYEKKTVNL